MSAPTRPRLEVLATGPLALLQDAGRPGHAAVGVPRSGAADRTAYRLANRLVANTEGAAAVEVLLGGLALRATADVTVAVTGAPAPVRVDGRDVGHHAVVAVRAGQVLALGTPTAGLRSYFAVRGGVDVRPVLGSRASDTLSGTGPPPLAAGDLLPVGDDVTGYPHVDAVPPPPGDHGDAVALRVVLGPRHDWLDDPAGLVTALWRVTPDSDRVGVRLDGPPLRRHPSVADRELPSEGTVRGAVQVPPSGRPVLFGPDHPVTGGYPVAGVLLAADADRSAQLRPGERVRLVAVPPPW
ncbi:5-oxoprolinase subunit C family protein [Thalassiella azotivora]